MTVLNVWDETPPTFKVDRNSAIITGERNILVETSTYMSYLNVLATPAVGVFIGDYHPDDSRLLIKGVDYAGHDDTRLLARIRANYSSEIQTINPEPNPIAEPYRVTGSSEWYDRPAWVDIYGEPLWMSSREFPEGMTKPAVQETITITRNYPSVPNLLTDNQGFLNSVPLNIRGRIFPARTVKMGLIGYGDELIRNNIAYYKLTIPLIFRREGWKKEYLDQGYYEFKSGPLSVAIGGDGRYQQEIRLKGGVRPSSPVPLDGNGVMLANPTPANMYMNQRDVDLEFDMNVLVS